MSKSRLVRSLFVAFIFGCAPIPNVAVSQQLGNRSLLVPGGPVGAIRDLAFSDDSRRLYGASLDKQVHVWTLNRGDHQIEPRHSEYLRWEITRGNRGAVYCVDVSKKGVVAFSGLSARDAGDICIYDKDSMLKRLPQDKNSKQRHRQSVIKLEFSPSGKMLASLDLDGETRLWGGQGDHWNNQGANGTRSFLVAPKRAQTYNQSLAFISDRYLAYSVPLNINSTTNWQVAVFDCNERTTSRLPDIHRDGITAICSDRFEPKRWASSDLAGNVFIWRAALDPNPRRINLQPKLPEVRDIQFLPYNRLLVTTAASSANGENQPAMLVILDLNQFPVGRKVWDQPDTSTSIVLGASNQHYPCAVSPDGKAIACYASDANEVWLFQTTDPQGKPVKNPFALKKHALSSRGILFDAGRFGDDSDARIELKSRSGKHSVAFDFANENAKLTRLSKVEAIQEAKHNWKLLGQRGDLFLGVTNQITQRQITLNSSGQGPLECYCWLTDKSGQPYAVAIGTSQQNGIFVYSLRHNDASGHCHLLRYYRDHRDRVTSLAVSNNGKYLLSTSLDQTTKLWSLEGLDADATSLESKFHIAWGAKLQKDGPHARIANSLESGIAWQRELTNGVLLKKATWYPRRENTASEPTHIANILASANRQLWETCLLEIEKPSRLANAPVVNKQVVVVPGWQPIVTLFVTKDQGWVAWTPHGYYASSVQGDNLFGWLRNDGRSETPAFFRGAHLRKHLEKPEVIRNLLSTNNLSSAFKLAKLQAPTLDELHSLVGQLLSGTPRVRILGIESNDTRLPVTIRAGIQFASEDDCEQFDPELGLVKAFLNGRPLTENKPKKLGKFEWVYEFVAEPEDRSDIVQVKLFDAPLTDHLSQVTHDDQVILETDETRIAKLRLHYVGIGVSDYLGVQNKLTGKEDVEDVYELLQSIGTASGFQLASTCLLREEHANRENVTRTFRKLAKIVRPNDVVVAHLAGHGQQGIDGFEFVPQIKVPKGLRMPTDSQKNDSYILQKHFDGFVRLPCRRLFIVDTCHAGQLGDTWFDQSIRHWNNLEAAVWCSAAKNQNAMQEDRGRFTKILIQGIKGGFAEFDGDQFVSLREADKYVARAFAEINENEPSKQTPKLYSASDFSHILSLPLFKAPSKAPSNRKRMNAK